MPMRLQALLSAIQTSAGNHFSGVGLIVTAHPGELPIVPLRDTEPPTDGDVVSVLAAFSAPESPFHDGFHVLSPEYRIIRVAQYFSPPIIRGARIDRTRLIGGRYVAALFGSALPGVDSTGVASATLGVSIFEHGRDVTFEQPC